MKPLNFNKVKKTYLTVTFSDEDNTTIMIGTPTKAIMDDLLELQDELNNINEDETDLDSTDNLYSACAKVMSRNKGGVKISKEFLEEIFDFEDITIFFDTYMKFIDEVTNRKNQDSLIIRYQKMIVRVTNIR